MKVCPQQPQLSLPNPCDLCKVECKFYEYENNLIEEKMTDEEYLKGVMELENIKNQLLLGCRP